jgi:predicted NAD/FAD-binding protein
MTDHIAGRADAKPFTGSKWNRREILLALAGAASIPALNVKGAPRPTVGIVGAGMAGVSLAALLDRRRNVVLFEAGPAPGGNVQSVKIVLDGQTFVVDVGAQYFHPALYPTYTRLLGALGLLGEVHSFTASITLEASGAPSPLFVSPIFPGRVWPLVAPWNRDGLEAFGIAFADAKKREDEDADWNVTMEEWLQTLPLSPEQWEGMILPWAASLFSGSIDQARGLSARAAMIFAAKALPENPTDPLLYYVLKPGMAEVLRRLIAGYSTVETLSGAPVTSVTRNPSGGYDIQTAAQQSRHVDELVFASSGPATLDLLRMMPDTAAQQIALEGIEFHDARVSIHTDAIYSPANGAHRSFHNARIENGFCETSMWLADVIADTDPSTAARVWKSWTTHRVTQPAELLLESQFRHMLPTPQTLQAQTDLLALQGQENIWFAGGYTRPFDSQETALVSATDTAQALLAG